LSARKFKLLSLSYVYGVKVKDKELAKLTSLLFALDYLQLKCLESWRKLYCLRSSSSSSAQTSKAKTFHFNSIKTKFLHLLEYNQKKVTNDVT